MGAKVDGSPSNGNWLYRAMTMLPRMKEEYPEATGEEMRIWLLSQGLDRPASSNAWGSLTNAMKKSGKIVQTGRRKKMWTNRAHGRTTDIWRFT